jgi:sterol desaturase/sphingolipid hydroxylase (fatty acid hydroxylase superfamily)
MIRALLEYGWVSLFDRIGNFGLFLSAYTTMGLLYGFWSLVFYFIDKYRLLDKYKIQKGKYATDAEYIHVMKTLIWDYLVFILPIGIVTFPFTQYLHMSTSLPLPSFSTWCLHTFICLVGEDFFHYWIHRYLHTPWAYKNIHKDHHLYLSPFGLTATYSHPIEIAMEGVATFLPVLILRPHFFTFYTWFILRQLDAVYTHCGYDLPVLGWLHKIPFYGGVIFHDYHHKAFTCNYASRFTYLDVAFGKKMEGKHNEK